MRHTQDDLHDLYGVREICRATDRVIDREGRSGGPIRVNFLKGRARAVIAIDSRRVEESVYPTEEKFFFFLRGRKKARVDLDKEGIQATTPLRVFWLLLFVAAASGLSLFLFFARVMEKDRVFDHS